MGLGDLVLRSECEAINPNRTWIYRNEMLKSDRELS